MFGMKSLMPWTGRHMPRYGKRDVMHPMDLLHRDMERVFDDFWRDFEVPMFGRFDRSFETLMPKMDVLEEEDSFRLTFELPGMDEKDVEVELQDNVLTVKGEKKSETEEKEDKFSYTERSFGSFHRSIPLGVDVLSDKVEASFDKGVLTIVLPKSPEAKKPTRKIPVHTTVGVEHEEKKAA